MNYQLLKILKFTSKKATIQDVLNKYFDLYENILIEFKNDLEISINQNKTFVYPTDNTKLCKNVRMLTIAGFLLCYEITNNDMFTIYAQQFIDNKKLITPDVFFYILVMLNEILSRAKNNNWQEKFVELINIIDAISKVNPNNFRADLAALKDLKITRSSIEIHSNNSKTK